MARSSTHSKRRSNNGLARQVFLGSLRGHRPSRHSPSDPASQTGAGTPLKCSIVIASAMCRSEEGMFRAHIPKLNSSASCFIQSRILEADFAPSLRGGRSGRFEISALALPHAQDQHPEGIVLTFSARQVILTRSSRPNARPIDVCAKTACPRIRHVVRLPNSTGIRMTAVAFSTVQSRTSGVTINEQISMISTFKAFIASGSIPTLKCGQPIRFTFEELLYRKVSFADVNRGNPGTFGKRAEPRPHKAIRCL